MLNACASHVRRAGAKTGVRALVRLLGTSVVAAVVLGAGASGAAVEPIDWATSLGAAPAAARGTTESAVREKDAPVPSCSDGSGVVWYTVSATRRGPMMATVGAGKTDAGLVVVRLKRSTREELACKVTDRLGNASAAWYGHPGQTFLVGVMRRATSKPGPFSLSVVVREPTERPPGAALARDGVTGTVTPLVDAMDAWSVRMTRGTSYKVFLTGKSCVRLDIFRPTGYSFADEQPVERGTLECGGYTLFTPGIDGGGVYSFVVSVPGTDAGPRAYSLRVAAAGRDDTAPGIALTSGEPVSGELESAALDVVDLYAFTVPAENSLTTIDLRPGPRLRYELLVTDETGEEVLGLEPTRGKQLLQERIPKGRYFLALRAGDRSRGVYRLEVLTREVTSTTMLVNGSQYVETAPGTSVPLQVSVTAASHGGTVDVEIDRFDPLFGWQYATVVSGEVDAYGRISASWLPPWAGHWRALARYRGNVYSTPSQSEYVRVHVAVPFDL